jgi:ubiquinone/menaquinone biosynthesis C-methylase UbiE
LKKTKVEEVFDKYAKGYASDAFAPSRYHTARAAMSFADDITWHFLTKYLPKRKSIRILDAGGGDGYWAQKLVERGYANIVLADLSQGMLEEAGKRFAQLKARHNVEFVKSDIADLKELAGDAFDFVFSQYDAVSYCLRPQQAMRALARVAKLGAYVVVSLDTKFRRVPEIIEAGLIDEAEALLKTGICRDFDSPQYNLTWEELAADCEQAGLTVVEVIGAPVFMHHVNEAILSKLETDPKIRALLLRIELDHCTNRSLVNSAGHPDGGPEKPKPSADASNLLSPDS